MVKEGSKLSEITTVRPQPYVCIWAQFESFLSHFEFFYEDSEVNNLFWWCISSRDPNINGKAKISRAVPLGRKGRSIELFIVCSETLEAEDSIRSQ